MKAPNWSIDREPEPPEDRAFVDRFADMVERWEVLGVSSDSFQVFGGILPLVIILKVPGVVIPDTSCTLQIAYWPDQVRPVRVSGEWGDDHILDGPGEEVIVDDMELSPEVCAEKAIAWLEDQLRRPLVRRDWSRKGKVIKSEWILDDTRTLIAAESVTSFLFGHLEQQTTRLR